MDSRKKEDGLLVNYQRMVRATPWADYCKFGRYRTHKLLLRTLVCYETILGADSEADTRLIRFATRLFVFVGPSCEYTFHKVEHSEGKHKCPVSCCKELYKQIRFIRQHIKTEHKPINQDL